MLDQEKPDLAVITCENAQHLEVMYECAVRGVNVSIEKPMATDLSTAMEMIRISNTYGVKLFVQLACDLAAGAASNEGPAGSGERSAGF